MRETESQLQIWVQILFIVHHVLGFLGRTSQKKKGSSCRVNDVVRGLLGQILPMVFCASFPAVLAPATPECLVDYYGGP